MLVLTIIDNFITALALAVVAVVALRGGRGSRPVLDLSNAPPRLSRFREDSVLLAVCVYILAAALLAGMMGLIIEDAEDVRVSLVVNNGTQVAAAVACLLIARQRFDGGVRAFCFGPRACLTQVSAEPGQVAPPDTRYPRSRPTRRDVVVSVYIVVLALGLCPLVQDATRAGLLFFDPEYDFTAHRTLAALRDQHGSALIVVALWIGAFVVAPIAEEFFFRGIVQTYLVRLFRKRWAAIALTSLAFGMIHFQQVHAIPALVFLAVLIGYAYERTGSLLPPVAIHAAFNLKTLVWSALGESFVS